MANAWIFVAGVAAVLALYLAVHNGYVVVPEWISSLWIVGMFSNIDSGCFKVLFSSYQIIQSVSFTMEVVFPWPFSGLLNFLSFISFDISTLDCLSFGGEERVYNTVYAYSLAPIIIALLIIIVGAIRVFLLLPVTRRTEVVSQHSYALLLLSYLVMPPVTTKQFQALNCFTLQHDDERSFLRQDSSIICNDSEHEDFMVVDAFLIILYMLIPPMWIILLRRVRHRLVPKGMEDEAIVVEMRDKDAHLSTLSFLFRDYKVNVWYWEALEMIRRVFFCGVIPLMSEKTFTRGLIGLALSLASIVTFREVMPFRNKFASALGHASQIVIFVVFGAAVTIEADLKVNPTLFGSLLCVATVGILAAATAASLQRHFRKRRLARWKREQSVQKIEWACNFSATKFRTTFEKVTQTAVPPSHALAFVYGSISQVKKMLRSGIIVDDDSGGIVVSLHQPHDLMDVEDAYFPHREAFVACSVLKESLEPFSADDVEAPLRLVSAAVLTAMRGAYFGDVVDPRPWLEGKILLPPQCIVRAYLLDEFAADDNEDDAERSATSPSWGGARSLARSIGSSFGDVETTIGRKSKDKHDDELQLLQGVTTPRSVGDFLGAMEKIRSKCDEMGWVPLYHYTMPAVAPFILGGGFRMSTQGQGDGGVYFST